MTSKQTRFNFVSETGDGMGFAARLTADGEAARMWIRSPDARAVGDNLVTKVGDPEDMLHDADTDNDIFIFDTSGNGIYADYLQSLGFAVLGGSVLADRLERDREFGASVMEDCGIEVPETETFTSFEDGIRHVEENPDIRWVYKPSKQLGDLSPSHVSYDTEDLVEMLQNIQNDVSIVDPQFELQAFEPGVAFSTELWFQHGQFIAPLTNHTLERKELMNEDIGPSGGCLGNLTWFCGGCLVCSAAMGLTKWAKRVDYHGMLDLNVIVAEANGQIYGLEFTPRFGYDASPTLLGELVQGGLGRFFADAARGRVSRIDLRDDFAGAVRLTIPPWPTEKYTAEENVPIRGIEPDVMRKHTYLYNVKKDDNDQLCSAGAWGIVALFTHRAGSVSGAMRVPLDIAREVRLKNKQFRTDLSTRFRDDLAKLDALGVKLNVGASASEEIQYGVH
jgi:phosphoribosylamine--glycine ligase